MEITKTGKYNFEVVRWFAVMAVVYLAIGGLIGVYMAMELSWPVFNLDIPYLTFGRLRPLHTDAVIFAFGGCVLMATAFYSVQHTCATRLWNETLGWICFWLWNLSIIYTFVISHLGLLYTGAEYAELDLGFDVALVLVMVLFTLNLVMTIVKRESSHIYVSNWFFLGMLLMIASLYVINRLPIPANPSHLYSLPSSGEMNDAIGKHYAVIFFYLTVGFLGVIYYFLPKQADRPMFSDRLSVLHFWGLMFCCVWLGVNQLQLPFLSDRFVSLGFIVYLFVIVLSWIGALNGVMPASSTWSKLRSDYILRFLVLSLIVYAISSFDDPGMSADGSDVFSQYTTTSVGRGHLGALGWVVMAACGALYHMIEKLWNTRMYSSTLVNLHFWMAVLGAVIYISTMAVVPIMQSMMWSAYDEHGNLAYTFAESVEALHPFYVMRAVGGAIYWAGTIVMLYNAGMTIYQAGVRRRSERLASQAG